MIDRLKVKACFEFFKAHNHLFGNVKFDDSKLDEAINGILQNVEK
jgi:hypothetical protein